MIYIINIIIVIIPLSIKVISTHIFDGWIFHSQRYFKAPASALLQPLAAAPRVAAPPAAAAELR